TPCPKENWRARPKTSVLTVGATFTSVKRTREAGFFATNIMSLIDDHEPPAARVSAVYTSLTPLVVVHIQELRHDRCESRGGKDRVMSSAWNYGELRIRHSGAVPSSVSLTAAQNFEELYCTRRANRVCISEYKQHRGFDL